MKLREVEDWILLIGTVLAAFSGIAVDNPKLALVFVVIGAIGKALMSLIDKGED